MMEKFKVYTHCLDLLESKIKNIVSEIKSFQETSSDDTKSSSGDKFETTRAMMDLEKEKAASQLERTPKNEGNFPPNHSESKARKSAFREFGNF